MYPSDLTDKQWSRLAPLLNEPRGERHAGGRPRKHEQRRAGGGGVWRSDLRDKQWSGLAPLLNEPRGERHAGGRPRKHEQRRVVDALLYVVKTGCQWRQLPSNFPPWKTVHEH